MKTRHTRLVDVTEISQGLVISGRGAGARAGDWELAVVSVGDIHDDRIVPDTLPTVMVEQNVKTEKHLLRPEDVLVTARSTLYKAALVPPQVTSRTVADATLLVVRPRQFGLGPYLWWYLTSPIGREQTQAKMTGSTVLALTASNLADLEIPLPDARTLDQIAELVDASEHAYLAATEAARLRRTLFRDAMVDRLAHGAPPTTKQRIESNREKVRIMMAETNRRGPRWR